MLRPSIILGLGLLFSLNTFAKMVNESFYIFDPDKVHLNQLKKISDLTIDHVGANGYELYGPEGTQEWLKHQEMEYIKDFESFKADVSDYPSPEEITTQLRTIAQDHPEIIKLYSIGQSHQGRALWMVKISDNPNEDEIEPEVKYIANMHGNEIVGRELMVRLIADIAKEYKEGNSEIKSLVNNTEIYIMPSMNPDGAAEQRRGNGRWADLNRDFPDFTTSDRNNTPDGREPETQAVMNFQSQRNFSLSANFHGGAVVMNYPWDTTADQFPEHDFVVGICRAYANLVPEMRESRSFQGGVTNGHAWYEVDGGMQDWSYQWHSDLQVTIELSEVKWPNYSSINAYYRAHKRPLINYLRAVHRGSGFSFTDAKQRAVEIEITSEDGTVYKDVIFGNEYFKVLPQGNYEFSIKLKDSSVKKWKTAVVEKLTLVNKYHQI